MMRLLGKRAIVTGGARGIGHGVATRFLQEGANVVVIDRNETDLQASSVEWKKAGYEVVVLACDLSDRKRLEEVAFEAISIWNGVDILINNAGIAFREPFLGISQEHWDAVLDVNLNSMFRLSQIVAQKMVDQNTGGSIVNMSSKNGILASSMLAHYNVSKAGVILLTQSMAVELAKNGIRVNAVSPGLIDTPLDRELKLKENLPDMSTRTPMGRLGTIEEVANVFLFLASEESSYVTGATIVVDGGHLANASEL
jgi:NAD(P)-dependent dehydrogenase (short-subunit alcohol dehydrogenase family)